MRVTKITGQRNMPDFSLKWPRGWRSLFLQTKEYQVFFSRKSKTGIGMRRRNKTKQNKKLKNTWIEWAPEKAMAPHSSTLAWKIPWTEEPGGLQSMGSLKVRHDWATSLSLFTFLHWRGNGSPLQCSCLKNPRDGEPGGLPSMGSHRVGHNWSDLATAAGWTPICQILETLGTLWKNSKIKKFSKNNWVLLYYI